MRARKKKVVSFRSPYVLRWHLPPLRNYKNEIGNPSEGFRTREKYRFNANFKADRSIVDPKLENDRKVQKSSHEKNANSKYALSDRFQAWDQRQIESASSIYLSNMLSDFCVDQSGTPNLDVQLVQFDCQPPVQLWYVLLILILLMERKKIN